MAADAEHRLGIHNHQAIVIDEIAGMVPRCLRSRTKVDTSAQASAFSVASLF
jgi:hypothetical protein